MLDDNDGHCVISFGIMAVLNGTKAHNGPRAIAATNNMKKAKSDRNFFLPQLSEKQMLPKTYYCGRMNGMIPLEFCQYQIK